MWPCPVYQEVIVPLQSGDLLILTSGGVAEANNAAHEMFGFDRLERAIATGPNDSVEAMLNYLKREISTFTGKIDPRDDVTIVIVQV